MRRMLTAWDNHPTHPALPQVIADRLRQAGFDRVEINGHAFATVEMTPEAYGGALVDIMVDYAVKHGGVDRADAREWRAEQRDLNAAGEFYFACVQCCFTARKPD